MSTLTGDPPGTVRQTGPNPWRPLSPCSPAACVRAPARGAGPLQRMARLLAALVVVLAGLPLTLACRALPARRAALTRTWARSLLHALGVRIEVIDETATSPARKPLTEPGTPGPGTLVVANHVSWLDPLVIAATLPARPLAKREIAGWPVVRTLVAASGALFIDRERLYALPAAIATITGALSAGDTVVAFPEGTTWCGRGMGRFRPAVFQAALDAGAEVRPVTLRYHEGPARSTRACYVGDDPLLASALRVIATRDLAVEVRLLAPVRLAPTARRPAARAALAAIAEAHVRTGVPAARRPGEGV
ncbi:lysophospholipid acyltransferase family protein [Nonomuraea sp. NPDC002799]